MPDKRLIVNADGFGFGPGATRAIIDAVQEGRFIKSVSVNPNFPETVEVRKLLSLCPEISIGVHLNPLVGRPVLPPEDIPTLVDKEGNFHGNAFKKLWRVGRIPKRELFAELDAQIARVYALAGEKITHLDSQANTHLNYFRIFLELAKKWNIRKIRNNASLICLESKKPVLARKITYMKKPHIWAVHKYRRYQMNLARAKGFSMADALITVGYSGSGNKTRKENWENILKNLQDGTFEIYCHPAYPDPILRKWSYYCEERQKEFELLSKGGLSELAQNLGIELINFHAI